MVGGGGGGGGAGGAGVTTVGPSVGTPAKVLGPVGGVNVIPPDRRFPVSRFCSRIPLKTRVRLPKSVNVPPNPGVVPPTVLRVLSGKRIPKEALPLKKVFSITEP
jgi:hypothetical protein